MRSGISTKPGLLRRFAAAKWFRTSDGAMAATLAAEPQAFPELASLGQMFPDYRRIFHFPGEFIDAGHRAIAELPAPDGLIATSVQGFLRPADALALYELAYFAAGDILEIGSYRGLSTTFLCRAASNARRGARVWSIELDPECQKATADAVSAARLDPYYQALPGDAHEIMRRLIGEGRDFSVIFVDHDHSYAGMAPACSALTELLRPGGMALFHDFNDAWNASGFYGIYQAVGELLQHPRMSFLGVIGCCALLRKTEA
jgi:SAM-dependent methyltransferase